MSMQPQGRQLVTELYLPRVGCALVLLTLCSLCVLPWLVVRGMDYALVSKLHLTPAAATLTIVGIFVGSFINIPLYRVNREEEQLTVHGIMARRTGWVPLAHNRMQTVVALNLGGCLIPAALAVFEMSYILSDKPQARLALAAAVAANIGICYWLAKPLPGIGIALPALVPVMVALASAWLLLSGSQYDTVRAPVAFVSGVAGPLIGADLLNLRRFERISAGVLSIGGAGTFDGIVICSLLAAFLA
jgi:uncharacterized membrane protein